jgi:reductive dehalogenase
MTDGKPGDPGMNSKDVVYRDQKGRYPWWVKSVDKITTQVDETIMERPKGNVISWVSKQPEHMIKLAISGRENYSRRVQNNEPGTRLQDVALHQAASSFWWAGGKMNNEMLSGSIMELVNLSRSKMCVNPEDFGVGPWEGTQQEASEMVEGAGIFLGAAQIGFTQVNENWLPPNVSFDTSADEITRNEEGLQIYPERFKYVVTGVALVPCPSGIRSPTAIGAAADRLGFEHAWLSMIRMINFLTCLGYGAEVIPSFNPVPWAVASGLGELGRMNRMISPFYGGGIRLFSIITDLPLGLDKPVDFGLQEFCKHCNKCAEACPSGALSMEDEPSWEWEGEQPWHFRGKKVWWDNSQKCHEYQIGERCINCMMSCPWTKQDKTALHEIAHIMASHVPQTGTLLRKMDDLFGYGLIRKADTNMNDWWKYKVPISGIDSNRRRR